MELAKEWSYGVGGDDPKQIGPLVSASQRDRVVDHVSDALNGGARLLLGGSLPKGPGFFYPPTVIADVPVESLLMKEETFGPVVSMAQFNGTEEEAISLANNTEYGLCATVFCGDIELGERVGRGICCGQLGINRYLGDAPGTPWVGRRHSGVGFLCGVEGVRQFTIPKSISKPRLND